MSATAPDLDRVFFALSDPTRRAIVGRLAEGPATVGALAEPFPISAPAISKHMKVLERAGLVNRRIEGRVHRVTLESQALATAQEWLDFHRDFWESRLDELERVLDETRPATDPDPAGGPADGEPNHPKGAER